MKQTKLHAFDEGRMVCISHRGAMGHEPENTLRSVKKALALGAAWIEVDVYEIDQQLVVIHDDTLDRTTSGRGRLIDQSFMKLRSLDAGKGEKIPTLSEVFDLIDQKAGFDIEIKQAGDAKSVVHMIHSYIGRGWNYNHIIVCSFIQSELIAVRQIDPQIATVLLFEDQVRSDASFTDGLGLFGVGQDFKMLNKDFVSDAHKRGLKVLAYTVNDPRDIERMRELQVDAIVSNFPERVVV